jgi:chromosome segregation protein
MNAKPEDRRSIFEEATGIVVFKDRKAEAERKLEASKDNLFVFAQRMQEVERQMGPLKKASENALKYRELYSNLRHHEMNLYICRHDSAAGEREALNEKSAKINARIEEVTALGEKLLEEYQTYRDNITDADLQLQDLNERLRRYEVGIEHRSGESKLFTEKARSVKAKLSQAQEDIAYSTKRIDDIDREIRRAEAYAEKNRQRLENLHITTDKYTSEIEELSKKISEYEFMTGEHRKKVMDTLKDLSDIRQNMGSLSAQKDLLTERLQEIRADMERVRERRDGLRKEHEDSLKRASALSELLGNENEITEKSEAALRECEEKINLIINQIYDAQAQITGLESNLTTYRALRDKFEGYIYSVRNLLSTSKHDEEVAKRIEGLIADVVTCGSEYEVAIETAFGGAMQNVITKTREDAQWLIEYLKRTRGGQVTFLPIEALRPRLENDQIRSAVRDRGAIGYAVDLVKYDRKFENVIHNLLGNTLICDNIQNATQIARRYPRAFRIVTLDGDVISTTGSMTGGSRREVAGNLLANERKIKEIEDGIESKKSYLARAQTKRAELEEKKAKLQDENNALAKKLQDARLELAGLTEKQAQLLGSVTSAESECSAYEQSIRALEERLSGLEGEYSGVSAGASGLTEQSDKASSAIDNMSAEYDKLVAKRTQVTERLNATLVEIASIESAVKSGAENVRRLTDERCGLSVRLEQTKASIPQIEEEMQAFTRQAQAAALSKDEQEVVDDLHRQVDEIRAKKEEMNKRMMQFDSERLATYREKEELTHKQGNIAIALQKIDSDLEYLQQRISEEYGETYEGCLQYKEEGYDPSQSANAIANYKRQITMLGPVNHNAVEEYEELSQRYEKMTEERQDLEKAIDDLTKALDDIRAEMLKIFNEGFDLINENFKKTFRELFGGGKAELQLDYTNCDDPLNAGVEIIACPPGKKLTKISLLSGGERALTAIAILFAIIGMRPMPFCVLDEIEAALDEANVARYAKYLKKFATDTQFIVITHRKPTMENADILFGVTMEEKGVSKIVSVKLSEVEQKLGGDTVQ